MFGKLKAALLSHEQYNNETDTLIKSILRDNKDDRFFIITFLTQSLIFTLQ